ncbi:hypothetical protein ABPG74_014860 [Tetrahymena malaccensis]
MSAFDREKFLALKQRNKDLELKLESIEEVITQYKANESAADQKIKALNSIHQDKIRSLMNSIQLLKKENAQLEKLTKEHKRSELITQLQKDVSDQDLIIETIREVCKNRNISDEVLDNAIVDVLNKGPPRIRAPTREELKMEIKKQKGIIDGLKKKKDAGNVVEPQDKLNKSTNESMSMHDIKNNQSMVSQLNEAADSNDNLIRRLEELKHECDELRLNLKAEQQIVERYEDQLVQKSEELNEMRSAKTDFIILSKKYETLQVEFEKIKDENNRKFINTYDKELKLEEMEIVAKTQQDKIKMQEQNLQLEMDSMSAKLEDVMQRHDQTKREYEDIKQKHDTLTVLHKKEEQKNRELNSKFTTLTMEFEKLQLKYQSETKSLNKNIESLENKLKKANDDIYSLQTQNENLQEQVNQLTIQVDEYKEKVISGQGVNFQGQNWAFGRGGEDLPAETRELRDKIRELTIREIDLQEQLETLKADKRFREQRELAQSILSKKDATKKLGNIEIEKLKKEQINIVREEYETRLTQLRLKLKELQDRNNQLSDIRALIVQSEKEKVADEKLVDISSLKSLERHKENLSENSNISDVNAIEEKITQGENRELKKKLQEMIRRQQDLQKQIDYFSKEKQEGKRPSSAQNDSYDKKLKEMQTAYQKEIKALKQRIMQFELKEINLSQVSSQVSDINRTQNKVDKSILDNMSSNVQLSLSDIDYVNKKGKQQNQINIHDIDSDVSQLISKRDMNEEFDSMSSGISNISRQKKQKSNNDNIFQKKNDYQQPQLSLKNVSQPKIQSTKNISKDSKGSNNMPKETLQNIQSIKNLPSQFSKINSDIGSIVGKSNQDEKLSIISSDISGLSKQVSNLKEQINFRIRKDSQQSINSSISGILKNNISQTDNNKKEPDFDDINSDIDDLDQI